MKANRRLTSNYVDQLPFALTTSKPAFYWDSEVKGFGIKVSKTDKRYIAETKVTGKTCRVTIDSYRILSAEEARKKAKSLLGKMHSGINPNKEERIRRERGKTFEEVCNEYLSERDLADRTKRDYLYHLNKSFQSWLKRSILDINRDDAIRLFTQLASNSPAQANQAFRFARAIFRYAKSYRSEENIPLLIDNPIAVLSEKRLWKRITPRSNYLKESQLPSVWEALWSISNNSLSNDRETARDVLLLLIFSGLRLNEALGLSWKDIDFKEQVFTISKTKNHQPHTLPMSEYLYAFFLKRKELAGNSSWIFPSYRSNGENSLVEIRGALHEVSSSSGVKFTPHDLRRTFITIAKRVPGRYNIFMIKRLANHKISDVTADYMQIDMSELRSCMQEISEFILDKSGAKRTRTGMLVKKSPPPPINRRIQIRRPSIELNIEQ